MLLNLIDMKLRVLSLLGVLALGAGTVIQAQDYDDIYYDGSSTTTEVKQETKRVETAKVRTEVPTRYKVTVEKNYQTERDVDEYNRRGGIYAQPENDTLYLDEPTYDEGTFGNTKRIERFYNPDIVILSDDAELVELYYDNAPTVNLIIGSNYGYTPRVGWGFGYTNYWYDPWYSFYDPFWDPWYYSWHRPYYGWYGWHGPRFYTSWSWGWGWHGGWRGWYDPWARPWGHYGPHRWSYGSIYHNTGNRYWHRDNRLPGDHRSLLNGSSGRRGFTGGNSTGRSGVRTASGSTRSGGTINNGRTRPSTMIGTSQSRTRAGQVGNIDRTTRSAGASGGYSGGSVRNRGTSGSSYSGSSSTRSYSPSTTRSYSGSSRSSGYSGSRSGSSYGGSRSSGYSGSSRSSGYSGGSFGGSSRGGGGSYGGSYGGGSSRGGGGGGGRRH